MTEPTQGPPRGAGALEKREARLALVLLAPTFAIVALVVALPLIMNFWISAKPVMLADLRPPEANINERVSGEDVAAGDTFDITYTLRNTSPNLPVSGAGFSDEIPAGATLAIDDDRCTMDGRRLTCKVGELEPRGRERFKIVASATEAIADVEELFEGTEPTATGRGENALLSLNFSFENFQKVFDAREFWTVLWTSIVYAVFGTGGALLLGLFAALLLNNAFRGRAVLRGLFLFPYVAPVIAVAYTWVTLLDPSSGTLNAILMQMGVTDGPINFLGQRTAGSFSLFGYTIEIPLALTTVIVFEAWRYFPLSFLFILARMQSINTDMYEAAEIDGASPFQQFWYLSLPQLATILAILFLLRYIWTFNKFDDIFLLTGGAAGTRTLTVNVYEQAIGLGNIGAGAAVAVVVFVALLAFALVFFRFAPKES
ncbi:carbohydrate ABC transporter permease [Acuticoccus sp. I52.16.1]|uniref:carbohydrate ABC transporter permease n=1 Tax=Acuticoccus sp. I52.16.1 TaxID=2928472 RepID=UPI001FD43885|nr:sugar ABC transporter permease [Acuticoccus sp. I52.16.1]UOM34885.1 sugar ABC transporter permease [Acuticoccus sp. I52.16.1]